MTNAETKNIEASEILTFTVFSWFRFFCRRPIKFVLEMRSLLDAINILRLSGPKGRTNLRVEKVVDKQRRKKHPQ